MSSLKRKANGPLPDAKKAKADGNIMSFFGGKAAASTPSSPINGSKVAAAAAPPTKGPPPPSNFNKAKWVASLTEEQKKLLNLEIDTLHDSWLALLKDEVTSKEFLKLKEFLLREEDAGKRVFPPKEDIYSWYVSPRPVFLENPIFKLAGHRPD
jgi:uracil-DNA glycosylase